MEGMEDGLTVSAAMIPDKMIRAYKCRQLLTV
jgi:hypothetical protein